MFNATELEIIEELINKRRNHLIDMLNEAKGPEFKEYLEREMYQCDQIYRKINNGNPN